MVALVHTPCRSGLPSGVRGTLQFLGLDLAAGVWAGRNPVKVKASALTQMVRKSIQPANPLFLVVLLLVVRGARTLRTQEEFLTVRQCDVAAVGPLRSVLRLIAFPHHRRSRRDGGLGETAAQQNVRAAGLYHPGSHGAVGALHIHMNPAMRIDELHLRNHALKMDRLLSVKFRRKGVMGPRRHRTNHRSSA